MYYFFLFLQIYLMSNRLNVKEDLQRPEPRELDRGLQIIRGCVLSNAYDLPLLFVKISGIHNCPE